MDVIRGQNLENKKHTVTLKFGTQEYEIPQQPDVADEGNPEFNTHKHFDVVDVS